MFSFSTGYPYICGLLASFWRLMMLVFSVTGKAEATPPRMIREIEKMRKCMVNCGIFWYVVRCRINNNDLKSNKNRGAR